MQVTFEKNNLKEKESIKVFWWNLIKSWSKSLLKIWSDTGLWYKAMHNASGKVWAAYQWQSQMVTWWLDKKLLERWLDARDEGRCNMAPVPKTTTAADEERRRLSVQNGNKVSNWLSASRSMSMSAVCIYSGHTQPTPCLVAVNHFSWPYQLCR